MKYMSTSEAGQKWGISKRRVIVLCKEERIPGAQMAGRNWIIPEDVEKPADARIIAKGDYLVMVVANTEGADYTEIDTALDEALK